MSAPSDRDQREKAMEWAHEALHEMLLPPHNALDRETLEIRYSHYFQPLYDIALRAWDAGLAAGRDEEREECAKLVESATDCCLHEIASDVRARRAKPLIRDHVYVSQAGIPDSEGCRHVSHCGKTREEHEG